MNKLIYFTILGNLILISTSCNQNSYVIKIIEDKSPPDTSLLDLSNKFPKDSINIEFGLGFQNDNVCIFINDKEKVCDTLITDPRIDIANSYRFGELSNIKSVGIKINNGNIEKIELNKNFKFMYCDFYNKNRDTLTVTLSSKAYAVY